MKVASFIGLIGFVLFAVLIQLGDVSGFDDPIIEIVQGWESEGLTRFMETFSTLGSTWYTVGIAVGLMLLLGVLLGYRKELVFFALAQIGSVLLNNIVKALFERERPTIHRLASEDGFSFPSGHAMASFTLAVTVAYLLWRQVSSRLLRSGLILLAVAWFLVMGVSRVYLGVHYPSDVVAGYLLSGFWVGLSVLAYRKWTARSFPASPSYSYDARDVES